MLLQICLYDSIRLGTCCSHLETLWSETLLPKANKLIVYSEQLYKNGDL